MLIHHQFIQFVSTAVHAKNIQQDNLLGLHRAASWGLDMASSKLLLVD